MWLATFYLCIPVGYALGYIYGGIVGVALGWRAAFLIEALAMLPFVAICFVVPPVDIKGTHDGAPIPCPCALLVTERSLVVIFACRGSGNVGSWWRNTLADGISIRGKLCTSCPRN